MTLFNPSSFGEGLFFSAVNALIFLEGYTYRLSGLLLKAILQNCKV